MGGEAGRGRKRQEEARGDTSRHGETWRDKENGEKRREPDPSASFQGRRAALAINSAKKASIGLLDKIIRFSNYFPTFLETSTFNNYHSEDPRDSGSREIEFSLKSTSFLY